MNPLLEQLHDIEGLDPISWWPLPIGWWVLIVVGIFMVAVIIWFAANKLAFRRSWKNDALKNLARIEQHLSDTTTRETAIALSEYLRRIALRRFSRKECAGLAGEAWLKWLAMNDPKGFDWQKKGTLLIDAPYTPVNHTLPTNQVKDLIQAVRNWVH
jgi:hypothetical protein